MHYKKYIDEFGNPVTFRFIRHGIYWNEDCESWSVYPKWGHCFCESISKAKRLFKSVLGPENENGLRFPILPPCLKGGYNRKENHLRNHFDKEWLTHSQRYRIAHHLRKMRKFEKGEI